MKLEVGKTYVDRKGNKVRIIKEEPGHAAPFLGDDTCGYTIEGSFVGNPDLTSPFDLIAEHKEPEE